MSEAAGVIIPPAIDHLERPVPAVARCIDAIAIGTMVLIPLLVVPSFYDPFRQPKLLLFHAAGISLVGVMAVAAILGSLPLRELVRRRMPDMLVMAILAWTLITAAFASHRRTALFALLTAASAAALFFGVRWSAQRLRMTVLFALVVPALVNAGLAVVQELKIWNEIAPPAVRDLHVGTTALLGNPNDIGNFLAPALIVVLAWALATKSMLSRVLLFAAGVAIAAGIAASRTRGAILGVAVGIVVLIVVRWRRKAVWRLLAAVVVAALVLATSPTLVQRVIDAPIQELLSGRVIAFAAAWRMFTESPVFGIGPGCFEYAYFDYAAAVYPSMLDYAIAGRQYMFGEAHNDHLQIAAETGLIGYLLFAASLICVGAVSRRRPAEAATEPARFARLCGAPLAASLAALALFQFPLYLTASLTAYVFAAALVVGWPDDEAVAG